MSTKKNVDLVDETSANLNTSPSNWSFQGVQAQSQRGVLNSFLLLLCWSFWFPTLFTLFLLLLLGRLSLPLLNFILLLNSPESPVYLVAKGEIPQAEKSLARLNSEKFDVGREIKEILQGLERCQENNSQARNKSEVVKNIKKYPEVYKPFLIITFLR